MKSFVKCEARQELFKTLYETFYDCFKGFKYAEVGIEDLTENTCTTESKDENFKTWVEQMILEKKENPCDRQFSLDKESIGECKKYIDVNDMSKYPYKSMVKIESPLGGVSGSGAMIGNDLILTAGHNVKPIGWSSCLETLKYKPSFPVGDKEYSAKAIYVQSDWYHKNCYERDFAIVQTQEDIEIDTFLGVKIYLDHVDNWMVYGYPTKNISRDGFLYFDEGNRVPLCLNTDDKNHADIEITSLRNVCLSKGASGGPQIPCGDVSKFETVIEGNPGKNQPQYIGGINSHICEDAYNVRNSPYLGEAFKKFVLEVIDDIKNQS